jgi:hypothetical protein
MMLSLQSRAVSASHRAGGRALGPQSHICRATVQKISKRSSSVEQRSRQQQSQILGAGAASSAFAASFGLYLLSAAPAVADVADAAGGTPFQGVTANSLYVTLALFLMTAPGELLWVQLLHAACRAEQVRFVCTPPAAAVCYCRVPCMCAAVQELGLRAVFSLRVVVLLHLCCGHVRP